MPAGASRPPGRDPHEPGADRPVSRRLPGTRHDRPRGARRREGRYGRPVLQVDCTGVYTSRPTMFQRLEAHVLADRLDGVLAAGLQPESDVLLALRAQRLACESTRRYLAASLRRLVSASTPTQHDPRPLGVMAVLPRVAATRADFESLIDRLLTPAPVSAQGVALVHILLRDGSGPLYRYESRADLGRLVRAAVDALDPTRDWPG